MQRRQLLAWGSAALVASPTLFAQGKYPQRPITLVVPTAPGGSTDFTARLVSDQLSRALGQPVIVDNKPGASGNIGNQLVARAKADGYTLLVSYSGYHVGNPHLFKQAGWDPIKDFAPVAMMTRAPQVVAARPGLPAGNLKELIAYAKDNPGKLNYASSGNGSVQMLNAEVGRILASAEVRRKAEDSGTAVELMTPVQLGEFTRKELDYWGRVIKGARITAE